MDAVLGLSVTPSAVGLVLVEGQDVDGITLDGDGFEVGAGGAADALCTSEQATAAVRRSEAVAADLGRRVHSIGVTWSDDADTEASLLLKSLSAAGFDNIVPVRLSEATDALARRIAKVMGYRTTAVCVIEPEQLIALVATDEGAVQTAVNHSVVTEEDLIGWLSSVFARADWAPEALVLVGSAEDLDGLSPILEDALAVPVFSPDAAQLALARGAALACASTGDFDVWPGPASERQTRTAATRFARSTPVALLAAGVVTFVASVSVAVALALMPGQPAPQPGPAAESAAAPPTAAPPRSQVPPPPVAAVEPAPEPVAALVTPEPEAPPPVAEEAQAVPAPFPEQVPVIEPVSPEAGLPAAPPVIPAPEVVPPVPQERPGILQRIRDRLSNVGPDDSQQEPVPPPPAPAPPLP
ncbi:DUF7159 family protein [Mycolicibacterium austroafricanum]|uniref:DUF7159 family protein n=1 Tax=Mycolicibacterium austroafricanum TaxID=39687 RepID=UPI001CA3807D|nr:hypothetical protein [Mycolicibacterium austroafricanum]QZT64890.1 hypothetical protein JN085_11560 [Mycolicibacterium austroafricanum]